MSADNAIVIINFLDQSRVAHLQAIENLWYSFETSDEKTTFYVELPIEEKK